MTRLAGQPARGAHSKGLWGGGVHHVDVKTIAATRLRVRRHLEGRYEHGQDARSRLALARDRSRQVRHGLARLVEHSSKESRQPLQGFYAPRQAVRALDRHVLVAKYMNRRLAREHGERERR